MGAATRVEGIKFTRVAPEWILVVIDETGRRWWRVAGVGARAANAQY